MFKKILFVLFFHIIISLNNVKSSNWFTGQLFEYYSNDSQSINTENFKAIWNDLNVLNINKSENYTCYSSNDLLSLFNITNEINHDEFSELSSAIIWQLINPECKKEEDYHHHHEIECEETKITYLYGIITIVVTWALSIFNVFILSQFERRQNRSKGSTSPLVSALNALAIGTLLGDALLHIIPSTLGLHDHGHDESHDHNDHSHLPNRANDEHSDMNRDPLWKMSATIATIFALFLFEVLLGHSHDNDGHSHGNVHPSNDIELSKNITKKTEKINLKSYLKKIQPNGWVAFIGDMIHKSADGLAIGAAFSESLSLGFSTSIAILFHEIPHELGDYAILKSAGFSNWAIFFVNTISSSCCLVGFLIISAVTPDKSVREWMFAIIAGVFFYLSMVVMLPRLKNVFEKNENGRRNFKTIISVIVLFSTGWVMMLLIAYFEDDLLFKLPGTGC